MVSHLSPALLMSFLLRLGGVMGSGCGWLSRGRLGWQAQYHRSVILFQAAQFSFIPRLFYHYGPAHDGHFQLVYVV